MFNENDKVFFKTDKIKGTGTIVKKLSEDSFIVSFSKRIFNLSSGILGKVKTFNITVRKDQLRKD